MRRSFPTPADESGFTLVEVLVASFLLVVGMLGTVALVDAGNKSTSLNLAREGATGLAREVVERSREVGYASLTKDANGRPAALLALPGLGSAEGGTWTVTGRRNIAYTVSADVCSIDSAADGINTRDSAYFCDMANPGAGGGESPPPGTAASIYGDLVALGINIDVDLSQGGIDALCNILGANANLTTLLGGIDTLISRGADVRTCGSFAGIDGRIPLDPDPDDLKRLVVTVSWTTPRPGSVSQSTLIPNPDGARSIT